MTVGGAILGLPLAIIAYYLSHAAVEKYQNDLKAKLARRKAQLAGAKAKVKKIAWERKTAKARDGGRKTEVRNAEGGMRKAESKCKGQKSDDRQQKTDDRGEEGGSGKAEGGK
ncbi:MAG: hypothetical protein P8X90_20540 [Desulfobacterales bacterium]